VSEVRGGPVIDWCEALGVTPDELSEGLRSLWREQEEIFGLQSRLRDRLHGCPDQDLDGHLLQAERHMGEAAVLLGNSTADATRVVG
jgi:hypothetical protein